MADQQINASDAESKNRKILATGKVYGDSLPQSFRHCTPADALDDAKDIAQFLCHTVDALAVYEGVVSAEEYRGLHLVLDLLIDKLDIGSGNYKFPGFGWGDDLPALAERRP